MWVTILALLLLLLDKNDDRILYAVVKGRWYPEDFRYLTGIFMSL